MNGFFFVKFFGLSKVWTNIGQFLRFSKKNAYISVKHCKILVFARFPALTDFQLTIVGIKSLTLFTVFNENVKLN